uniref:phosphodiester glycosidase family protein n=1 Tax=Cyanobium sp. TaxID=2164130 RepID=UPI004049FFF1
MDTELAFTKNGPQDTSTEAGPLRPARGPWRISWLVPQLVPAVVVLSSQAQGFPPPPPPPPTPSTVQRNAPRQPSAARQPIEGTRLWINGQSQVARWRWVGRGSGRPDELWLPLEVLQGQLGVSSRSRPDGSLDLEWFGQPLTVGPGAQVSLDDEVAVDVASLFQALGVEAIKQGPELRLQLPVAQLVQVRTANQVGQRRVVLDLDGPAIVRTSEGRLELSIQSSPAQRSQLELLGLGSAPSASQTSTLLQLVAAGGLKPTKVFTLGDPARVVIDLPGATPPNSTGSSVPAPAMDPRLQALLGRGIQWDRLVRHGFRINAVRIDPRTAPVSLKLLTRPQGMEGLSSVQTLANARMALVAINGGYFNRVKRLPLGALKSEGRWLSGPILNRGVAAWAPRSLPRFGHLSLEEWLVGPNGSRYPVLTLNSGYVQRGISRYGPEWGPSYRALSGGETALVLGADSSVGQRYETADLEAGVPLRRGEILLVGRGGVALPWAEGTQLSLSSRPSNDLGLAAFVIGGGPLLLQDGRIVLNGVAEAFSAGFISQGAPRTVIASDGSQLWLITLEGTSDSGPSLPETAQLLQSLGLRDALNLDGGSSTGLVMGGTMPVKGRGVVGAVHNGLGLVP